MSTTWNSTLSTVPQERGFGITHNYPRKEPPRKPAVSAVPPIVPRKELIVPLGHRRPTPGVGAGMCFICSGERPCWKHSEAI